MEERRQLHDAQAKVDAAREKSADATARLDDARARLGEGGLSVKDIKDLDAELGEAMPTDLLVLPLAAAKYPPATADNAPAVRTEFSATADPAENPAPAAPTIDPRLQL